MNQLIRYFVIAFAAATAVSGLCNDVQASCGDWLADVSDEHEAASTNSKSAGVDQVVDPPVIPCPCRGPGCRQSPSEPNAPLPYQIEMRVDKLAFGDLADQLHPPGFSRHEMLKFDDSAVTGMPRSIYRPPQFLKSPA